jgi:hypothetical protein
LSFGVLYFGGFFCWPIFGLFLSVCMYVYSFFWFSYSLYFILGFHFLDFSFQIMSYSVPYVFLLLLSLCLIKIIDFSSVFLEDFVSISSICAFNCNFQSSSRAYLLYLCFGLSSLECSAIITRLFSYHLLVHVDTVLLRAFSIRDTYHFNDF